MQHDILLRSIDNYGFEVAVDSFVDCVTAVGLKRVKACLFTVIRKLTLKCDCKYSPNLSTSCNKTMQQTLINLLWLKGSFPETRIFKANVVEIVQR